MIYRYDITCYADTSARSHSGSTMEHFEIPEGEEAITIPYVCTEEYDGGDFLTYPQRKDWAAADLKSPLTCGRPI